MHPVQVEPNSQAVELDICMQGQECEGNNFSNGALQPCLDSEPVCLVGSEQMKLADFHLIISLTNQVMLIVRGEIVGVLLRFYGKD